MLEELKNRLGEEIERLTHELQVTLPLAIKKAVEHGDLRENSEYKARWSGSSSCRRASTT
jgi:transcription elongation factor GreA